MAAHYRERIEDGRLRTVAEHVRQWLFGTEPEGDGDAESEGKAPVPEEPAGEDAPEGDARPALRLYVG
jgi:hypothetical protein